MLQRGDTSQHRGDPTREAVAGDAEILQHSEAGERVEYQLATETEAVEDDASYVAGDVVANDAGPGGAG